MKDEIGPRAKRSRFGHCYVVYILGVDRNGPVKIGMSADMPRRVLSLQTGNPLPIQIYDFRLVMPNPIPPGRSIDLMTSLRDSATKLERHVHFELQKMGLRMMGEWFDLDADEGAAVLDKAARSVQCRAVGSEWLATDEARMDSEYGWVRDDLLKEAMRAKAQAMAINDAGLTLIEKLSRVWV